MQAEHRAHEFQAPVMRLGFTYSCIQVSHDTRTGQRVLSLPEKVGPAFRLLLWTLATFRGTKIDIFG